MRSKRIGLAKSYKADRTVITMPMTIAQESAERAATMRTDRPQRSVAVVCCATGLGLWMCPPFIVSDLLASGELVPLLPEYSTPEMEIVALYPHRRQLSAKVRLFLDRLVDRFAGEHRSLGAASDR